MFTPRLVVIDDHPAVRDGLASYFHALGYTVVVHPGAADAVAVMHHVQPTVALIDLHLEYRLAGLDVVCALRADPATRTLPVVVWSSDPDVERHVTALALPAVTAVSKHDAVESLQSVIAHAVECAARNAT